jgi:hypothetical protein
VVVVTTCRTRRAELAADPQKFYGTARYDGYSGALAPLPKVDVAELTELIGDPRRLQAPARLLLER